MDGEKSTSSKNKGEFFFAKETNSKALPLQSDIYRLILRPNVGWPSWAPHRTILTHPVLMRCDPGGSHIVPTLS